MLEDFDYMYSVIEKNYPFLEVNKRLNGVDWLANREEYRNRIAAAKTDKEFFERMNSVLWELNNKHTLLYSRESYDFILESVYSHMPNDNPWLRVLQQPNVLARYGRKPMSAKQNGAGLNTAGQSKSGTATQEEGQTANVTTAILKSGETAYLGIHSFEGQHMAEDVPVFRKFLQEVRDYETLILDIRGNGGGDSSYWRSFLVPMLIHEPVEYTTYLLYRGGDDSMPFLRASNIEYTSRPIAELVEEELPQLPPESTTMFEFFVTNNDQVLPSSPNGFKGKVYLLVDHVVYSASEGLAAFAKSTRFATVIGERTGGDGLGMSPLLSALPGSGYVFSYSVEMGLMPDGSCNEEVKTVPDVQADPDASKPLPEQPAIQKALELAASRQ